MPSISKIAATSLALTTAMFLTGTMAAAIDSVEVDKCAFDAESARVPSAGSNAVKRQTSPDFDATLESIFGKPPATDDDGRVLNVGVYVHVVGKPKNNESSEFLVSRSDLDKQIDAMNKYYTPANISFQLLDADWTNDVFLPREMQGSTARRALDLPLAHGLHNGNVSTLNMFLIETRNLQFGGTSRSIIRGDNEKSDGIVAGIHSIPGGSHPVWNMGVTAVHETGHWLGLLHTDFINIGDCEPNWRNRPNLSNEPCGARCDSNFMSYGSDACLTEFTPEQIKTMRDNAIKRRGL